MAKIQIINRGHHALPAYATALSAGMDLRANITEPIVLKPLERCLVPTFVARLLYGLYASARGPAPRACVGTMRQPLTACIALIL